MRMLFGLSAFALLLSACSNVESFRAPVENLTTEWDNTTTMITDFVNTLQGTQQQLQNQFVELSVPEELTLSEDSKVQVAALQQRYQEELSGLTEVSSEVSSFVGDWQAKASQLNDLKSDLESGSLATEDMAAIEELQGMASEGQESLAGWLEEVEEIEENAADALEEFRTLIANLQGN